MPVTSLLSRVLKRVADFSSLFSFVIMLKDTSQIVKEEQQLSIPLYELETESLYSCRFQNQLVNFCKRAAGILRSMALNV